MAIYLPYIVLLAVMALFFGICYLVFGERTNTEIATETVPHAQGVHPARTINPYATPSTHSSRTGLANLEAHRKTKVVDEIEELHKLQEEELVPSAEVEDKLANTSRNKVVAKSDKEITGKVAKVKELTDTARLAALRMEEESTADVEVVTTTNTNPLPEATTTVEAPATTVAETVEPTTTITRTYAVEDAIDATQVIAIDEKAFTEVADDATQMIATVDATALASTPVAEEAVSASLQAVAKDLTATKVIPAVSGDLADLGAEKETPTLQQSTDTAVQRATAHFLNSYGVVSEKSRSDVEQITVEALKRLKLEECGEIEVLLENIVVQEALFCMQKAYVTTPTKWMYATALDAFLDVVQQPKSSTPYLVAFDALRILPHLSLGHFQAMALVLMLQYSRNSNNYSIENFRHYVRKYLEPFMSEVPRDDSMYRQLDYLRCCVPNEEPHIFTDVLSASYPYVFNYRGFTMDELTRVLGGERLAPQFLVNSLNSSMKKLACVDESMSTRLFRLAHISDGETKRRLLALMQSKPTNFNGAESVNILEHISPSLVEFNELYNQSMLCQISLTLLGLYLARAHVKVTIGEEFDLSRWF